MKDSLTTQSRPMIYASDPSEESHSASRTGDLLRQLREAEGLSFGKLAKKAGVAKSTVLRAEHGHYVPTTEVLVRLCNALDVSYGDLAELVGFDAAKSLPEPAVYFRTKYGLPPAATEHLEQEFARVARAYGIDPDQAGPAEGEDEYGRMKTRSGSQSPLSAPRPAKTHYQMSDLV